MDCSRLNPLRRRRPPRVCREISARRRSILKFHFSNGRTSCHGPLENFLPAIPRFSAEFVWSKIDLAAGPDFFQEYVATRWKRFISGAHLRFISSMYASKIVCRCRLDGKTFLSLRISPSFDSSSAIFSLFSFFSFYDCLVFFIISYRRATLAEKAQMRYLSTVSVVRDTANEKQAAELQLYVAGTTIWVIFSFHF